MTLQEVETAVSGPHPPDQSERCSLGRLIPSDYWITRSKYPFLQNKCVEAMLMT